MDRKAFDSMDISNQIKFINEKLLEHKSLTKVCAAENLRRSTIRDRFKRYGYELINGQYEMVLTPPEPIEPLKHEEVTNVHKSNTTPVEANDSDILDMIKALQKEVTTLKEDVKKLKEATPAKSAIKDIELMSFTGDTANRSFRIDSNVLKDFNTFCKRNKKYKKQDLLSQAIQEFIDKYK